MYCNIHSYQKYQKKNTQCPVINMKKEKKATLIFYIYIHCHVFNEKIMFNEKSNSTWEFFLIWHVMFFLGTSRIWILVEIISLTQFIIKK